MKLSKGQKMGLALLTIAAVAMVIDRAFLGGGSGPVEASASLSPTSDANTPQALDPPDEDSKPSMIRLGERLETLWVEKDLDINQPRDIFTLPASWLTDILPKKPEDIPPPKEDSVTVFMSSHQLQAVAISDQTRCVTINDHVLHLGEELDGFKLVAIQENSATFEFGVRRVVLKLVGDR
ncbi:hypothetical protein ACFL5Z_12755 [Planctomycetota bacterium]